MHAKDLIEGMDDYLNGQFYGQNLPATDSEPIIQQESASKISQLKGVASEEHEIEDMEEIDGSYKSLSDREASTNQKALCSREDEYKKYLAIGQSRKPIDVYQQKVLINETNNKARRSTKSDRFAPKSQ